MFAVLRTESTSLRLTLSDSQPNPGPASAAIGETA